MDTTTIKSNAAIVRDATLPDENTAYKVGSVLIDIADALEKVNTDYLRKDEAEAESEANEARFSAIESLQSDTENRLSSIESQQSRVTNKNLSLDETGYYSAGGVLFNAGATTARHTGLMAFKDYDFLNYALNIGTSVPSVTFWDADKNLLPDLSIFGTEAASAGTVDLRDAKYNDAEYLDLPHYNSQSDFSGFTAVLYKEGSLEQRIDLLAGQIETLQKSKPSKILIFGDSITDCAKISFNENIQCTEYDLRGRSNSYTAGNGATVVYDMWPYILNGYFGCADCRNYALSGASFTYKDRSTGLERQNLSFQIELALNDVNNPNNVFATEGEFVPDVIIFALGTNDLSPTGSFEETMNNTVIDEETGGADIEATLRNLDLSVTSDAIRFAFLSIKRKFPQSLCYCVLPIQRADYAVPPISEMLSDFAKRYSIKIINGSATLGIISDLEIKNSLGTLLKDGLHPNDKGQKMLARMIIAEIQKDFIDL